MALFGLISFSGFKKLKPSEKKKLRSVGDLIDSSNFQSFLPKKVSKQKKEKYKKQTELYQKQAGFRRYLNMGGFLDK